MYYLEDLVPHTMCDLLKNTLKIDPQNKDIKIKLEFLQRKALQCMKNGRIMSQEILSYGKSRFRESFICSNTNTCSNVLQQAVVLL